MKERRARLEMAHVLLGCLGSLAGCANYAPYAGADAAKVRVSYNAGWVSSGMVSLRHLESDGRCSASIRPQPMVGGAPEATDQTRSSVRDVVLAPGRYEVMLTTTGGLQQCNVSGGINLARGGSYRLALTHGAGVCTVSLQAAQPNAAGSTTLVPQPIERTSPCESKS